MNINILPNGALTLNYDSYNVNGGSIDFRFSSFTCFVSAIKLNVVIFDTSSPGVLYLDGFLEQNSIKSKTTVSIAKDNMEQLTIYFLGLTDFSIQQSSAIAIDVSMNTEFQLVVDAQDLQSIGISYLVISFVQCGTCTGYPYVYDNVCSQSCPNGYKNSAGYCTPSVANCGSGYEIDSKTGLCVPSCQVNAYWAGNMCACKSGFNMINGACSACEVGTSFDYKKGTCVSLCGPYARYNSSDNLCYCFTGYYVVDGVCGICN